MILLRCPKFLRRLRRHPFFLCGEKKGEKNAAKTKVLEFFPRAECCLHRFPSAARMGTSKFHSLLSHCLCVYSRWPLTRARAALAQQGCPLRLSRSV